MTRIDHLKENFECAWNAESTMLAFIGKLESSGVVVANIYIIILYGINATNGAQIVTTLLTLFLDIIGLFLLLYDPILLHSI